jgi:release factor glutamine methyltransferase
VHTVATLLSEGTTRLRASGSATPRLDAELILGSVLGIDRTRVIAYGDAAVGDGQAATYRERIDRREAGEPVAYIRGIKEFHGLAFAVDARALIPRPETERLVDLAISEVADRLTREPRAPGAAPVRIADVGTGGGAIAVALAVALRRRRMLGSVAIVATDISPDALGLAAENVVAHAVAGSVELVAADLLPVGSDAFDLVLANLPYVRSDVLPTLPVATSFEPAIALDGGADGLDVVRRLLDLLPKRAAIGGVALLEIGADQGDAIADEVAGRLPDWTCRVEADLSGLPRVARVERAAGG